MRKFLEIGVSKKQNMSIAERFISRSVKIHGQQHPVSIDGGKWYPQVVDS